MLLHPYMPLVPDAPETGRLAPVSIYALMVPSSGRVRALYFPR